MTVVTNVTRGAVLASNAETARNTWARFLGLMGRDGLPAGGGLIFPGEKGVHTHFMRFPIDVVFYDAGGVVVDVVGDLRPWRFSPYRWRARGLVELPAGTAHATGTRPGDRLTLD
jgi:uncharacterized membrane protein (UPF0127 family)